MIKRLFHSILSASLAILLLFGSTSKEFIHLFTGHEDTVHSKISRYKIVIEPEHHHCTFLQFSLGSFVNDIQVPYVAVQILAHTEAYTKYFANICHRAPVAACQRGPPAMQYI